MSGIAVGLKKGHVVAKRKLAPRPAQRKGVRRVAAPPRREPRRGFSPFAHRLRSLILSRSQRLGARVKNIRELVRDVVGSAPYEKRLMELLKVGRDKRALKLAKRKVRRRPDSRSFLGFVFARGRGGGDPDPARAPSVAPARAPPARTLTSATPHLTLTPRPAAPPPRTQLGTHGRGKKKREEMGNLLRKMSRKSDH